MIIEDGTGTGNKAKVKSNGKLVVESTMHTKGHIVSLSEENAFISNTTTTARTLTTTVTGGSLLYIENTHSSKNLIITDVYAGTSVGGGVITFLKNMTLGTIGNNNAHVPVNLNFNSLITASTTCYNWNELGDGLTGLSGGTILEAYPLTAGLHVFSIRDVYALARTASFIVDFTGVVSEVAIAVKFFFHD